MVDNILREIYNLHILTVSPIGVESFSRTTKIQDLWTHYTSRFLKNITSVFSNFSQSELERYLSTYKRQTEISIKDPLLSLEKTIIPIPKGMVGSYYETLKTLKEVLQSIHANRIYEDLSSLLMQIKNNQVSRDDSGLYTRASFDTDVLRISTLYSKYGIAVSTAKHGFVTTTEIGHVVTELSDLVKQYYPFTVSVDHLVKTFDTFHDKISLSLEIEHAVRDEMLSTAYRISLFAVVMQHIQDMEHALIGALEIFRKQHDHR